MFTYLGVFVSNSLALALPVILLQLFDRVIPAASYPTLVILAIGLVIAMALEIIVRTSILGLLGHAGASYETAAQEKLFENLMSGRTMAADHEEAGHHLDRLETIDKVRNFRSGEAALARLDIPFAVLSLGVLFLVAPSLSGVVLAILLGILLGTWNLQIGIRRLDKQRRGQMQKLYSYVAETLKGIEHIKGLSSECFMTRRHERLVGLGATLTAELTRARAKAQGVTSTISQAAPVLVAGFGSIAVMNQKLSVGALAASVLLASRVLQPFVRYHSYANAERVLSSSEQDLNRALRVLPRDNAILPLPSVESLHLKGVGLRGSEGNEVLARINLSVERGQTIAISGASGSGKSALLSMLAGLLSPTDGQVLVNGSPILEYSQASLRDRISLVPQNPRLLAGTVVENLTRFDQTRYLQDALRLMTVLGLDQFFATHPIGLSTEVGRGLLHGFPGSVERSIPIIGTLVGNPDVILFDEANATLDQDADEGLNHYFASLRGQRTIVLVTQRPAYLKLAERTFEIRDRSLVETNCRFPSPMKATDVLGGSALRAI